MNDATHHFAHEAFAAIPDATEQERMVEAVLFASSEPLSQREIAGRLPAGCDVGEAIEALRRRYEGRGVQLMRLGDAWAFRTASDLGFLMSRQVVVHRKLSRAAIETLAIVAYHQPVTRVEIEEIRGVSVSKGTIDLLMELGWIKLGRRKQTPGRPVTFVVTPAFLDHFGLESEGDLPGLAELRASGLLDNRPLPGGLPGLASADEAADDEDETILDDADDLLV
jgi:segregation and condensation protein B